MQQRRRERSLQRRRQRDSQYELSLHSFDIIPNLGHFIVKYFPQAYRDFFFFFFHIDPSEVFHIWGYIYILFIRKAITAAILED